MFEELLLAAICLLTALVGLAIAGLGGDQRKGFRYRWPVVYPDQPDFGGSVRRHPCLVVLHRRRSAVVTSLQEGPRLEGRA